MLLLLLFTSVAALVVVPVTALRVLVVVVRLFLMLAFFVFRHNLNLIKSVEEALEELVKTALKVIY